MAKKQTKKPKKKPGKSKKTEEKDELSELLQESLKGKPDSLDQAKVSNLDLNVLEFQPLDMGVDDSKAPVLERIVGAQKANPVFVSRGPSQEIERGADSREDTGYLAKIGGAGEATYIPTKEGIGIQAGAVDFDEVGRQQSFAPAINQERFFENASESRNFSSQTEKYENRGRVDRLDMDKVGRQDPFAKADVKYQKYNPKLPKS